MFPAAELLELLLTEVMLPKLNEGRFHRATVVASMIRMLVSIGTCVGKYIGSMWMHVCVYHMHEEYS